MSGDAPAPGRPLPLRTAIFWIHLALGICTGIVILVMSVSGAMIAYEQELVHWVDREFRLEAPGTSSSQEPPLEELVARARTELGFPRPASAVTVYADPTRPVEAAFIMGRTAYIDAAGGTVMGEGSWPARRFFRIVNNWHQAFGVGGEYRGLAQTGVAFANAIFLFMIVTGLYLWVPRRWTARHFRAVLLFGKGLRGKARDFNWHHVLGIWFALPLIVLVGSGVAISYPWVVDGVVTRAMPGAARPPASAASTPALATPSAESLESPLELRGVIDQASAAVDGWRSIAVGIPRDGGHEYLVRVDRGRSGMPWTVTTLTVDAASAGVTVRPGFDDRSGLSRAHQIIRYAHTGQAAGWIGQGLAGLTCLVGALMVWTGVALSWRRLVRPVLRRVRGRPAPATP